MQDSITYSVFINDKRIGVYLTRKYAIRKIRKLLHEKVNPDDIKLIKSCRVVTFEKWQHDYYSRDEFLNDDGFSDAEKTEICESIIDSMEK